MSSALAAVYGRAAQLRRSWYARPGARAHLSRPVISIGNLVVGGSGKTPIVAAIARLLVEWGERPAILSRGYARRRRADGVLVVSDGHAVRATVEESGDEPLMLARALGGVPVLVSPDRYLAGVLAERQLGATVLLLDDGFQHVQLARTVDLLVVSPAHLLERVLPAGRLREPLSTARAADAVLVYGTSGEAARVQSELGVGTAFTVTRRYRPLRPIVGNSTGFPGRRAVAVEGIAQPERFFVAVQQSGIEIAERMIFRDHHWFTRAEILRIGDRARSLDADCVVTTEKDAVRLEGLVGDSGIVWAALPMDVALEPVDAFTSWLRLRLARHAAEARAV